LAEGELSSTVMSDGQEIVGSCVSSDGLTVTKKLQL